MNHRGVIAAALLISILSVGCMEHHPVTGDEMNRLWTLGPDLDGTAPHRPTVSGTRLPGRWIIRHEESLLRSTISIVRAMDRLDAGAEVMDISVSCEHAEVLSGVLRDMRGAVEGLRGLRTGRDDDYSRWARSMAHVLAQVESVARRAGADTPAETAEEPVGLSARPMLEMLILYADEHTGGQLLGDLGPGEVQQVRNALGQLALRVGFALAGRELDTELRERLIDQLRDAEDPYAAEDRLAETLLQGVRSAAPATAEDTLAADVQTAMSAASKALTVLDGFVGQWNSMDRIELALLRGDEGTAVEAIVAVQPGREVRIPEVMPFQPVVAFRGTSRITVSPRAANTGEVVVGFDSEDPDAGVQLRFEGVLYALARLLVVPLDDARLRELRVLADRPKTGTGMIHAVVLMEATGRHADPRRLLVYREVRRQGLARGAFSVEYPRLHTERTFSYITPVRRYSFYRIRTEDDSNSQP